MWLDAFSTEKARESKASPTASNEFEAARFALQRRDWRLAAQLFESYVASSPSEAFAWANLSLAYQGLNEYKNQLVTARRAIAVDSSLAGYHLVLCVERQYVGDRPVHKSTGPLPVLHFPI